MSDQQPPYHEFSQPQDEPLFMAIPKNDSAMLDAYNQAAQTTDLFKSHLQSKPGALHLAKLRFRDPDESERLTEDRYVFMWLGNVLYHSEEELFFR